MVELYAGLQPILDPVVEQREEAVRREDAAEADDLKQDRIAVAVVGVPNAVSLAHFLTTGLACKIA